MLEESNSYKLLNKVSKIKKAIQVLENASVQYPTLLWFGGKNYITKREELYGSK